MIGLVLFVAANAYSYYTVDPPCCDRVASFGFPFELGKFGGLVGYTSFNLKGLAANGITSIVASIVFGCLFAKSLPIMLSSVSGYLTRLASWHARTRL